MPTGKKKALKTGQNPTAKKTRVSPKTRRQRAFLAAYVKCATITHAVEAAKIHRNTHYWWLKHDPEYEDLFAAATIAASDALIKEARRRAVEGVGEPVFYQGQVVGAIQKYSDSLLMFLIKGDQPEKYRERTHVTGNVSVGLEELITAGRDRLAKHRKKD